MPRKRKHEESESGSGSGFSSGDETGGEPARNYWLIKSEPETRLENGIDMKFSFEDLKNEPDSTAHWDGVRNYQARCVTLRSR